MMVWVSLLLAFMLGGSIGLITGALLNAMANE